MASELTKQMVIEALSLPVEQRVDGKFSCRVCGKAFPARNSVGVHELTHRREVGLAPPQRTHGLTQHHRVRCQYEGCRDELKPNSLYSHLQGGKHRLTQEQASWYAAKRMDEESARLSRAASPALVGEVPAEPEPESPLTDITASEAVTGILSAARNDGLIPTRLLPHAFDLVRHCEAVLEELRRLS